MSSPREVPVRLPSPILPGADWADAFEIVLQDRRLTAIDAARVTELEQGGIAPKPSFLFPSPTDPNCTGEECSPPPIGCVGVECFDPGFANNPVRTLWTQDGIE